MKDLVYLVFAYLRYHWGRTIILATCLGAALYLPATMNRLVHWFESEMLERAEATPVLIGAQGSQVDLTLHALHFRGEEPGTLPHSAHREVAGSGLARSIPIVGLHTARGKPVIGTTLAYFDFRSLQPAQGHLPVRLGDAVVGYQVAQDLNLSPRDGLVTDPENIFDLAGGQPIELRITGVLAPSHGPDDQAIFVDLRTAWLIEGIGHGHDEASAIREPEYLLEKREDQIVASPALPTHMRVTDENIGAFHFHGDPDTFPLTAIIAVPKDEKSGTILLGRFPDPERGLQAFRPSEVIRELFSTLFHLQRFFHLHHTVLLLVSIGFLGLVFILSHRLRHREFETMIRLGCGRATIAKLLGVEMTMLLTLATLLAWIAYQSTLFLFERWLWAALGG